MGCIFVHQELTHIVYYCLHIFNVHFFLVTMSLCPRSLSDSEISKNAQAHFLKVRKENTRRSLDITNYRSKRKLMQDNLLQLEKRRSLLKCKDNDLKRRQEHLHLLLLDVLSQDEEMTTATTCESQSDNMSVHPCLGMCTCHLSWRKSTVISKCSDCAVIFGERHDQGKPFVGIKTENCLQVPPVEKDSSDVVLQSSLAIGSKTPVHDDLDISLNTTSCNPRLLTNCKRLKRFVLGGIVCCSKV